MNVRNFTLYVVLVLPLISGCDFGAARRAEMAKVEKAETQVRRVAEELDRRTTEADVYVRAKEGDIKERDPWGTPLKVNYSQGGVAELVHVRSAGTDREFQTQDDVKWQCIAANLKGIGEGIKMNAEQTASNVAKGIVKGAVTGVKEAVRESLPFQKKKAADAKLKVEQPGDAAIQNNQAIQAKQ
jgi:hypothetical protein